ncbi:hypothetical protein FOMPIDRAFT_117293 [Fomitopsis schrenkii]|uniref:DUF6533 domain-containing protein n=1 Tax=Fomitopsis schrenkii TaxID=2126942 RepID=S8F9U7_FOMSC|nr:hypothetical protein FOMPIDRAFT_117293 [Fomitopsis schrenkii]
MSFFVDNACFNAAFALYFYERLLTFDREVDLVWRHASKGLLMPALHASMHICMTLYLLLQFAPSSMPCKSQYIVIVTQFSCVCALYLIWGGISALRIYAINGRRIWAAALIMTLSLVPVATNVTVLVVMHWVVLPPPDGCEVYTIMTEKLMETATRASVIAADALVLIATWRNTYGVSKLANGLHMKSSITSLLLRDGTTYFCVLLALNIIDTVLWATRLTLEIDNFCFVVTTILLSRFFFNLREVALVPELSSSPSDLSDLHFSRVLGTLGGTLADAEPGDDGAWSARSEEGTVETSEEGWTGESTVREDEEALARREQPGPLTSAG